MQLPAIINNSYPTSVRVQNVHIDYVANSPLIPGTRFPFQIRNHIKKTSLIFTAFDPSIEKITCCKYGLSTDTSINHLRFLYQFVTYVLAHTIFLQNKNNATKTHTHKHTRLHRFPPTTPTARPPAGQRACSSGTYSPSPAPPPYP